MTPGDSPSVSASDLRLVAAIERAFAAHAGPDARIDRAEMQAVLGVRTPALAERIFARFDADGDGVITQGEFVAAVRALVGGGPRDKLAFAFGLHDADGDGAISHAELRAMVTLGLAEDDVSVDAAQVDAVTRVYIAHADTDGDGRISFAEFEALTARYPALLAQMTRSEARWIAPNEDLLARLAPTAPARRPAGRRLPRAIVGAWAAVHVAIVVAAFLASGRATTTWLDRLGNACTTCIELDVALVLITALRRGLTWLRATRVGRALPIDDAVAFHRLVGHVIVACALGHTAARLAAYARQTRVPFVDALCTFEGLSGAALVAMLAIMWMFARAAIRRSGRFEWFYWTHLLYVPFLALGAAHAPAILAVGGVATAGLVVEHVVRLRARGPRVPVIAAQALRSGVTRLELQKPPGFAHPPGGYVFVRVPAIARHEWHPFTLSSAPEAPTLTIHVRSLGNWTRALRALVDTTDDPTALAVHVDGPYGAPSQHLFEARSAVMIGAGIGVTPFAAILDSIVRRAPDALGALAHVDFIWLARDAYSFEWFTALLAGLEAAPHAERVGLHLYMTGGHAGLSAAGLEVARELLAAQGHADLVTGLQRKTHMGHPDWAEVLGEIQRQRAGAPVHIFFCGPPGLGETIAAVAARLGMPFRSELF